MRAMKRSHGRVALVTVAWVCAMALTARGDTGSPTARAQHSATHLPNGTVLLAGGSGASGETLTSAELYDPAAGTWSATRDSHPRSSVTRSPAD